MTTTPANKCAFCDKRGLPLFLVRESVALAGKGAPLSAGQPLRLKSDVVHYTKRILRSGYLNLFDEARNRWECYYVTPDGYYFQIPITNSTRPSLPTKPFNCPDDGHKSAASVITIADPKNATRVWIGFSDVLWTPSVRKLNASAAYRERHMIDIDIKAIMADKPVPHTRPLSQLSAVVAEYAISAVKGKKIFEWNSSTFISRHGNDERLRKECDIMRPGKARIVTVPDPVGVTQELALLTQHMVHVFKEDPVRKRLLNANQSIALIKAGVVDWSKFQQKTNSELMGNFAVMSSPGSGLLGRGQEMYERASAIDPKAAAEIADSAWGRYSKKYDDKARAKWLENYQENLGRYDRKFIAPLAGSHVAWMSSVQLKNHMACNYDDANKNCALVYTMVVTQCAAGTQDKSPAISLYRKWLEGEFTDSGNLLLRAMVGNQKALADAINDASKVKYDWRSTPWDQLFKLYEATLGRKDKATTDVMANLVASFAGIFATGLGNFLENKDKVRGMVMGLGLISGHPIVKVTVTGTRKDFRRALVEALIQANQGPEVDRQLLFKATHQQLQILDVEEARVSGTSTATFALMADAKITGMPLMLGPQGRADWLVKHARDAKGVDQLNLKRFRVAFSRGAGIAIVAGLLQLASFTKMLEDERKSLGNTHSDAFIRCVAAAISMAGTLGDFIGNAWQSKLTLTYAAPNAAGPTLFLKGAGLVGVVGALIVSVLDGILAYQAFKDGDPVLGRFYVISSLAGASLAFAVLNATALAGYAVPIIIFLALIVGVVALAIESRKDNPLMDWLERCPWGINEKERYENECIEQAEFLKAMS